MKKIRFFTSLLIVFLAFLGLYQLTPPVSVPTNAPIVEFSSGRAMKHLDAIAKAPHPIGSPENTEIRNYILQELTAKGLTPEIKETTVVNPRWGSPFDAGTVHNIIVRLEGTQPTKAVLLMSHYDSVPNGAGASDDGVGVAAMLETLRALKVESPLKNDVIFLFSDGEEPGLLGAKAFVDEHPWAKEIGVVLNFEARGNQGPSILFETSSHNGRLIREFAKAAPHPIASSLFYSIYTLLPNDTDLTIFKEAGFPGVNFAFIDGLIHYHTQSDNLANVSSRSLQHHGENMLALTRHLGNIDISHIQEPDAVYFNLINPIFIQYPGQWVIPLSIFVVLLFGGVAGLGLRQKQLTLRGILTGFGVLLLIMASAAIAVTFAWWLISSIHSGYQWIPQGDTYNSSLYTIAFVSLSIAIAAACYSYAEQRTSIDNLTAGAMLWWLILMISTSLYLPGASYLFTWPLLFTLIGFGLLSAERVKKLGLAPRLVILSMCAIPGILLLVPTIYLISIALTVSLSGVIAVLVVLLVGLLIPQLALINIPHRWLLPKSAIGLTIAMILAGGLTAGFDANHPKPNSLFYGLNADTGKAIWASADSQTDEWTAQFLSTTPKKDTLTEYFPMVSRKFLQSQAPTLPLIASKIEILSDGVQDGVRNLHLHITSPRQARILQLSANSDVEIFSASVNDKKIKPTRDRNSQKQGWGLNYFALPQKGIDLTLAVKPSSKFKLKVVEQSDGLPEILSKTFKPRSSSMMSTAFAQGVSDSTLVSKLFTF
jgi:hypothetical protein